jgi:hypothetical protein
MKMLYIYFTGAEHLESAGPEVNQMLNFLPFLHTDASNNVWLGAGFVSNAGDFHSIFGQMWAGC